MPLTIEEAKKLIVAFARNQVAVTHQANSRRGVTKKSISEEAVLTAKLLDGLIGHYPTTYDIQETIDNLS